MSSGPDTTHPPSGSDSDRFFELSLDLLCVAGYDGFFRRVNPSWTRVLGWTQEELLTRPIHEFMHPEDREVTLKAREGLTKGVPVVGLENRYLCKSGGFRWLAWQSTSEPGAALVFAIARDVTEQKQLDHERNVMNKMESTGILAGGLAHDFNNLLASLLLNLEMIGMCGPMVPDQKQHLEQSRQIIRSAKALTQQLIIFAGGDVSSRQTRDVGELLRQSLALALQDSDLTSECEIAPDLWQSCINETQIAMVLRGLILNAREASAPGGHIRIKADNIIVDTKRTGDLVVGDYVCIRIVDAGVGIPPAVMPKIFDPYFSTKNRGGVKGMGLGLAICRAVLKRHGGNIGLESQVGQGTTVTCYLPAALVSRSPFPKG